MILKRIYFILLCAAMGWLMIITFPVFLLTGKFPYLSKIERYTEKIADKIFSGWNAYYSAVEKEFLNNPFIEPLDKEQYKCIGRCREKMQILDQYDKDMSINWDKLEKAINSND